jgi:hypothetical protein
VGSHVAGAIDSELRRDDLHAWKPAAWAEPCQRQGNAAVERCRGGCACALVADVRTVEVVMVQENVQPSTSIHRRHGIRQKAVCTAATSNLLSVAMSEHKACKKKRMRVSLQNSLQTSLHIGLQSGLQIGLRNSVDICLQSGLQIGIQMGMEIVSRAQVLATTCRVRFKQRMLRNSVSCPCQDRARKSVLTHA